MSDVPKAAEGWYPDPKMANTRRYWDGERWTENVAPAAEAPPVAHAQPDTVRAPVPDTIRLTWARSLPGRITLISLFVLALRIVVGFFGIEGIESTLDGIAQFCLVVFIAGFWFGTFVEALVVPDWLWTRAGQTKAVFVALALVLPILGTILYLAIARPSLRASAPEQ